MKIRKCSQCPNKYSGFSNLCENCRVKQQAQKLGVLSEKVQIEIESDFNAHGVCVCALRRVAKKTYAVATRVVREAIEDHGEEAINAAVEHLESLLMSDGYEKWHKAEGAAVQYVDLPIPKQKKKGWLSGSAVMSPQWNNLVTSSISKAELQAGLALLQNIPPDTDWPVSYKQFNIGGAGGPVWVAHSEFPMTPFDKEFLPSIGIALG